MLQVHKLCSRPLWLYAYKQRLFQREKNEQKINPKFEIKSKTITNLCRRWARALGKRASADPVSLDEVISIEVNSGETSPCDFSFDEGERLDETSLDEAIGLGEVSV